jgi:hypothetical protein
MSIENKMNYQGAVVSADGLNAFAVHLVVLVRTSEVES